MSNSNKGAYKLADVLQKRMNSVSGRNISISAEMGVILSGNKLKIDSLPEDILDADDYSICSFANVTSGDRVLVVWSEDGEPIVVDKIIRADKA